MRPGQSGTPGEPVPPGVGMPEGRGDCTPGPEGDGDGVTPGVGEPLGVGVGDCDGVGEFDGCGDGDGGSNGTGGVGSGQPSIAEAWSAATPSLRIACQASTVASPPGESPAERTAAS